MKRIALAILTLALCACTTFNVADPSGFLGGSSHAPLTLDGGSSDLCAAMHSCGEAQTVPNGPGHKLGAGLVPQRAGDFFVSPTAASPFAIKDGSGVTRDTFETAHGRITAGGGGSDVALTCGPQSGAETTTAACVASTTASGLVVGTNKAGATLTLQADTASTVATLSSGLMGLGSSSLSFGSTPATTGELRAPNNATVMAYRNAANSGDLNIITTNSSDETFFGDCSTQGACFATNSGGAGGVSLSAVGGWGINWGSGGHLEATTGSVTFGTTNSNTYTTTLRTGNAIPIVVMSAPSGSGSEVTSITGALRYTTRTVTSALTVDTTTTDKIIIADTSAGVFTITLPTPTNGRTLTLIDPAGGSGSSGWALHNLTLARHGTEKINGAAASKVLSGQQWSCDVYSNGTDWFTSCSWLIPLLWARRKRKAMNDTAERARRWLKEAA